MIYFMGFKHLANLLASFSNSTLFRTNLELNFGFIAVAEIDLGFVSTQLLDFVKDMDPATINFVAFLVAYCAGQLY